MSDNMKLIMERFEKFSEETREAVEEQVRTKKSTGATPSQISDAIKAANVAIRLVQKGAAKLEQRIFGSRTGAANQAWRDYILKGRFYVHMRDAAKEALNSGMEGRDFAAKAAEIVQGKSMRSFPMRSEAATAMNSQGMNAALFTAFQQGLKKHNPGAPAAGTGTGTSKVDVPKAIRTNQRIIDRKKILGRYGIKSAADLNGKLGVSGAVITSDTVNAIIALQRKYNAMAMRSNMRPLVVDGLYGGKTARAQRRYNL